VSSSLYSTKLRMKVKKIRSTTLTPSTRSPFHGLCHELEDTLVFQPSSTDSDPLVSFRRKLAEFIKDRASILEKSDHFRVYIKSKNLKENINTKFYPATSLDYAIESITYAVRLANQSRNFSVLQDEVTINIIVVNCPSGTGRSKPPLAVDNDSIRKILSRKRSVVFLENQDNCCFSRAITYLLFHYPMKKSKFVYVLQCFRRDYQSTRNKTDATIKMAYRSIKNLLQEINSLLQETLDWEPGTPIEEHHYPAINSALKQRYHSSLRVVTFRGNSIFRPSERCKKELTIIYEPRRGTYGHYWPVVNASAFFRDCPSLETEIDEPRGKGALTCRPCNKRFRNILLHACPDICPLCRTMGSGHCPNEVQGGTFTRVECKDCGYIFFNHKCYDNHIQNLICPKRKKCDKCRNTLTPGHKCYTYHCSRCEMENVSLDHEWDCFVIPIDKEKAIKKRSTYTIFVFYDLETSQFQRVDPLLPNDRMEMIHEPVLACLSVVCSSCWGPEKSSPDPSCVECGQPERSFWTDESSSCVQKMIDFLMVSDDESSLLYRYPSREYQPKVYIFAHNGKRFDHQLLLRIMIDNNLKIDNVLTNGLSLLKFRVRNFTFLDSINFFPSRLSDLPKAFGLEDAKGFFPHMYTAIGYGKILESIPEKEYFGVQIMNEKTRREFEEWYDSIYKNLPYDFNREMEKYCKNDVKIGLHAIMKFRNNILQMSGLCPFHSNVSLPGVVIETFRSTCLQPRALPITPYQGYLRQKNVSLKSRLWLSYLMKRDNINIQFETKFGHFYIDGMSTDSQNHTAYEFAGCYWHGCPRCFPFNRHDKGRNEKSGKTFEERYEEFQSKIDIIKRYFQHVVIIWEHEWDEMREADINIQEFCFTAQYSLIKELKAPCINLRTALFGGRTNAAKLYHKCVEGERIMYKDIVSLYPYVLFAKDYPMSHPKIRYPHDPDFDHSLRNYFGLVVCAVLPPTNLYFPVLPWREGDGEKLLYTLCRTCVVGKTDTCTHTAEERSLTGIWTTVEMTKAIEKGYQILDTYCVYDYELQVFGSESMAEFNTNNREPPSNQHSHFTKFMSLLLKNKIKYSGRQGMSDEELDTFLAKLKVDTNIELKKADLEDNPTARYLAKLQINSFWGRLTINPNRDKNTFIETPKELYSMLRNPEMTVKDLLCVGEKLRVTYRDKHDFVKTPAYSSLITGIFVTSYARMELYKYLDLLQDKVLYYDTDSVFYILPPGVEDPIKEGNSLGQMSNELKKGCYITEMVCGACKSYGYKEFNPQTGEEKTTVKAKGFRLTGDASAILSFNSLRDAVDKKVKGIHKIIKVPQTRIRVNKQMELHTVDEEKEFQVVYEKRRLLCDFRTLPWGWRDGKKRIDIPVPNSTKKKKIIDMPPPSPPQEMEVIPSLPQFDKLTQEDIACLKPGQWVKDSVVNYVLHDICSKAKDTDVGYMDSLFYTALKGAMSRGDTLRWTIPSSRLLLVPIIHNVHWTMLVVNHHQKKFKCYDSLGCYTPENVPDFFKNVISFLQHSLPDTTSYETEVVELWKQNNGYDCGIYIMYVANAVVENINPINKYSPSPQDIENYRYSLHSELSLSLV
jgi:hypothetical protein